jgi:hypothetical protein
MNTPISFIWIIILFDAVFTYGDGAKFWGYVGINAEPLCAEFCIFLQRHIFVKYLAFAVNEWKIKLRLPEIQLLAVVERMKDREIPNQLDGVVRKVGRLVLSRTSCYLLGITYRTALQQMLKMSTTVSKTSIHPKCCYQSVYCYLIRNFLVRTRIAKCFTNGSKRFRCKVMFENEHSFCSRIHHIRISTAFPHLAWASA